MQSCSISEVITSPWGIHRCHAQPLYDCKMQLRPSQGSPTVMHSKLHTINLHFNTHNETTEVSLILRSRPNKKIIFDKTSLQQVKYKSGYKKKSDVNCKIYLCLTTQNWEDKHGSNYGGICSCMFCLRQQKIDRLSVSKGFSSQWSDSKEQTAFVFSQSLSFIIGWFCSELLYHGTCYFSQTHKLPLYAGTREIKTNLDSCLDTV